MHVGEYVKLTQGQFLQVEVWNFDYELIQGFVSFE